MAIGSEEGDARTFEMHCVECDRRSVLKHVDPGARAGWSEDQNAPAKLVPFSKQTEFLAGVFP